MQLIIGLNIGLSFLVNLNQLYLHYPATNVISNSIETNEALVRACKVVIKLYKRLFSLCFQFFVLFSADGPGVGHTLLIHKGIQRCPMFWLLFYKSILWLADSIWNLKINMLKVCMRPALEFQLIIQEKIYRLSLSELQYKPKLAKYVFTSQF